MKHSGMMKLKAEDMNEDRIKLNVCVYEYVCV